MPGSLVDRASRQGHLQPHSRCLIGFSRNLPGNTRVPQGHSQSRMRTYLDFEKPIAELESKVAELKALAGEQRSVSIEEELARARGQGERGPGGDLFRADPLAEDASCPPSRASAFPALCRYAGRGLHAAFGRSLVRRGPGHRRRHRPAGGPLGDGHRPREGLRHRRPHQAQFRHGASRRLPQGGAADGDGRPLPAPCGEPRRYGRAPIPASAPRNGARPRPSRGPPTAA